MARINLLPWREELRVKRQNEFIGMLAAVGVFAGVVMFGVHSQLGMQMDHQGKRNGYMKTQIASVDKKISQIKDIEKKKASLISRMDVIQKLQGSRPQIVHTFYEMASATPEGMHIYNMSQKGSGLTIMGIAQSNARVSSFMRSLNTSRWLSSPNLGSIKNIKSGQSKLADFILSVSQKDKSKKEEKK
jgi:type IV pilus assembly protein PilN